MIVLQSFLVEGVTLMALCAASIEIALVSVVASCVIAAIEMKVNQQIVFVVGNEASCGAILVFVSLSLDRRNYKFPSRFRTTNFSGTNSQV